MLNKKTKGKKSKKVKAIQKLVVCPECGGAGAFIAGHNASDSVDCRTCNGSGKVAAPKIQVEEHERVVLDGKALEKDKDYVVDSACGIVLSDKIVSRLMKAKSYDFSSFYYKSVTRR